jgi:glycosyltransferase involved in cell wall biosynthesis
VADPSQNHSLQRRAYRTTRSFLRFLTSSRPRTEHKPVRHGIKVAFIHNEKRLLTGAHHINELIAKAVAERGVVVRNFFPRVQLADTPTYLRGIANILFYHSLLEHKETILKQDVIQGTTYTVLPFLTFRVPTIAHFGSMITGFLRAVPRTTALPPSERRVLLEWKRLGIIPLLDYKTHRPLRDIADMEELVGQRATFCVATSVKVRNELEAAGVPADRIRMIHNAIEDYWFTTTPPAEPKEPHLVFLGRIGDDAFNLKLKGVDRLVTFYRAFPDTSKTTVCMTLNKKLKEWLRVAFSQHHLFVNMRKDLIPNILAPLYGSILFISSRYEGFSLSLVEGMSQGLVPVAYSVGVVPEIIRNGENGFIVENQKEAIERTRELLENRELRLAMAAAARETAKKFKSEIIADQLVALYRQAREEKKNLQRAQS